MDDVLSAKAPTDPAYIAVRDRERLADVRSDLRSLWARFRAHAGPRFLERLGQQFQQQYWEMRLGCVLLDLGFRLAPPQPRGPDFDASTPDGVRVYIEAVTAGPGQGPDAVPEPTFGSPVAEKYPTDQVLLRIRTAIDEKTDQRASFVDRGLLDVGVPYVVAINIGGIPRASVNKTPPTLVQACLGIGPAVVMFDPNGTHDIFLSERDAVRKASGSNVDTHIFLSSSYSWLSGALLSDVSAFRLPIGAGDFQFLHNPGADRPLPRDWFPIGSEHWVEEGRIHNQWREGGASTATGGRRGMS